MVHHPTEAIEGQDGALIVPMLDAPGFAEEVLARGTRRDVAAFVAVPVLLVGLYVTAGVNAPAYAFDPAQPTVLTAFLAHFAHASIPHLVANLVAYLGAVGVGYPLALFCGCRRLYMLLVLVVLLLLPVVLSAVSLLFLPSTPVAGFSGLALGLIGTIPPVLFRFLRSRVHQVFSVADALGLFLVGVAVMTWQTAASIPAGRPLAVAILGVGVVSLAPVGRRLNDRADGLEALAGDHLYLVLAAVSMVVLVTAMTVPSGATVDASRTTTILHLLGYCSGFTGALVTMGWLRLRRPPLPPNTLD